MSRPPIRVLVVDDSALMRQLLTSLLATAPDITVVGAAASAEKARRLIKELDPDVLTLDVEMPGMDGLAFLERLMTLRPMPVVMVSTLTGPGADAAIRAMELGAVDCVRKPTSDLEQSMAAQAEELVAKVRAAASARVRPLGERQAQRPPPPPSPVGGLRLSVARPLAAGFPKIIAIGASAGGVEALTDVVRELPGDGPPVLIAQHMPPRFTQTFAQRLDRMAAPTVLEAADGLPVLAGHVYIAPGTHHLVLARSATGYLCRLDDGPAMSGHKPSVDRLMLSVAEVAGRHAIGVILTGMGRDGAQGLGAMRAAGAATVGQDQATSMVYGMPRAAFEAGAVDRQLPLHKIAVELARLAGVR